MPAEGAAVPCAPASAAAAANGRRRPVYASHDKETVRLEMEALLARLDALPASADASPHCPKCHEAAQSVWDCLRARWPWWGTGSAQASAWKRIHYVRQILFLLEDADRLRSEVPGLAGKLLRLPLDASMEPYRKQRLAQLERVAERLGAPFTPSARTATALSEEISPADREFLRALRQELDAINDSHYDQVSTWRNVTGAIGIIMTVALAVLALWVWPVVPLGNGQNGIALWRLLALGAFGATLSALLSVRSFRPSRSPYGIVWVQNMVKLPSGAASALLGILLLQSGLVPTLQKASDPLSLCAWSIGFGIAERVMTRYFDRQVSELLARAEKSAQPVNGNGNS